MATTQEIQLFRALQDKGLDQNKAKAVIQEARKREGGIDTALSRLQPKPTKEIEKEEVVKEPSFTERFKESAEKWFEIWADIEAAWRVMEERWEPIKWAATRFAWWVAAATLPWVRAIEETILAPLISKASKAWLVWLEAIYQNITKPLLLATWADKRIIELNKQEWPAFEKALADLEVSAKWIAKEIEKNPLLKWALAAWEWIFWLAAWWALKKKVTKADIPTSKIVKAEKEAAEQVEQFLKPTKAKLKAKTKEITPWFLERLKSWQIKPWDRSAIKAQTEWTVARVWKEIGDFIEAWKVKWEVTFDKMLEALAKEDAKLRVSWQIIPWNEASVKFIDSQLKFLHNLEKQFGDKLPPKKQLEIRQKYDAVFDKGITRDKITKFQDDLQLTLADELRAELSKNNPDLAKLNKEFSFYKSLDNVLWETIERTRWQDTIWLISEIRKQSQWTAWAVIWWAIWAQFWWPFAIWIWAAIWWGIWAKLTKTLANPKYRLVSAKKKAALADAIAAWEKVKVWKALDAIEKSFILGTLWQKEDTK